MAWGKKKKEADASNPAQPSGWAVGQGDSKVIAEQLQAIVDQMRRDQAAQNDEDNNRPRETNDNLNPAQPAGWAVGGSRIAVSMSKQHYTHIADTLRTAVDYGVVDEPTRDKLADHFAHHLMSTNPNFDPDRFVGYVKGTRGPGGKYLSKRAKGVARVFLADKDGSAVGAKVLLRNADTGESAVGTISDETQDEFLVQWTDGRSTVEEKEPYEPVFAE